MTSKTPGSSPNHSSSPGASLTSAQFHILLTLSEGKRHGYGIMQEISLRTGGAMELGPGTLYRSIKQLLKRGLIVEVDPDPGDASDQGPSRRTYTLSREGKVQTAEEAHRLRELVRWAQDTLVLEGGAP